MCTEFNFLVSIVNHGFGILLPNNILRQSPIDVGLLILQFVNKNTKGNKDF